MLIKEANKVLDFHPRTVEEELVVQKMEDELLIYNLQTNQAMCLNQTAALVWENCDGQSGASEIAKKLEKKLSALVSEELVLFIISELNEKGLLENGKQMPNKFEGLSRREIVKKVGFASLVALPIISSIIAPKASFAQISTPPCVSEGGNLTFIMPEGFTSSGCNTDAGVVCDCSNPTRCSFTVGRGIVNVDTVAPCCPSLVPVPVNCRDTGTITCICQCQIPPGR